MLVDRIPGDDSLCFHLRTVLQETCSQNTITGWCCYERMQAFLNLAASRSLCMLTPYSSISYTYGIHHRWLIFVMIVTSMLRQQIQRNKQDSFGHQGVCQPSCDTSIDKGTCLERQHCSICIKSCLQIKQRVEGLADIPHLVYCWMTLPCAAWHLHAWTHVYSHLLLNLTEVIMSKAICQGNWHACFMHQHSKHMSGPCDKSSKTSIQHIVRHLKLHAHNAPKLMSQSRWMKTMRE